MDSGLRRNDGLIRASLRHRHSSGNAVTIGTDNDASRLADENRAVTYADSAIHKVLALLLLGFGTILLFNTFDRYQVIGPELLTDNRFQESLAHWQYSSTGVTVALPGSGIAQLQSEDRMAFIGLSQSVSPVDTFKLLRLSCELKSLNIPAHDEGWNMARVVLFSNDTDNEPVYSRPHLMAKLTGNHDWEHYEGVFPVYSDSPSVSLYVQIAQTTGTLWVKNLSLRPLAEKSLFRQYRYIAITLWALIGLWVVAPLIKSALGNTRRSLILTLALAVAAGVLMPEALKAQIGTALFPSLARTSTGLHSYGTFQFLPILNTPDIYKVGHFFLFALLAGVAVHRRPYGISGRAIFAYLILFAFVTEVLQLFVPGRTALLSDVVIDCAGLLLGLILQRIVLAEPRYG